MIVQLQRDTDRVFAPVVEGGTDASLDFAAHSDSILEHIGAVDDSGIDTAHTNVDTQDIAKEDIALEDRPKDVIVGYGSDDNPDNLLEGHTLAEKKWHAACTPASIFLPSQPTDF